MQSNKYQNYITNNISKSVQVKAKKMEEILNQQNINLVNLSSLVKEGIPDDVPRVRQYSWKLLLSYLPQERSRWNEKIQSNQKLYQQFINSFIPQSKYQDYPLVLDKHSLRWKQLQQDFLLWEQVQKDTSRTHSQLSFFSKVCKPIMVPFFTSPRKQKFKLVYGEDQDKYKEFLKNKEQQRVTYKYDIMSRILFIYAKLNPNIKYVQGMNQVLAPIFYTVNNHKSNQQLQQAACFFMFNAAMSEIIEMHIKDLDKSQSGIYGKLQKISQMLLVIEPNIWKRFKKLNIDPFYYSFRWLALLFAQDFQLFDTLRLWDSILSETDRIKYMSFIVIAILQIKKSQIMTMDFVGILQNLQKIREEDIHLIIRTTNQLFTTYNQIEFQQQSIKASEKLTQKKQQKKKEEKGSKIGEFVKNFKANFDYFK